MSNARMLCMSRKGRPNNMCFDKHWKKERNTKYGKQNNKYFADGKRGYPRKG